MNLALLRTENTLLRNANHELSRRRRTKKRRLQEGGSLTLQEAQALRGQTNPRSQLQVVIEQSSDRTNLSPRPRRRCTGCGEHGHNVRTCSNREEIPEDSDS